MSELAPGLYAGGDPSTPEAFDELASLGVRTIVSVDGARPNVEEARAHGIRSIHIPFGYDYVPAESQEAIAKVVESAQWPVYFHCHHGQHRGPIGAAYAIACLEHVDGEVASERLAAAGYPREYEALYQELESFDPASLDPAAVESAPLPEVAPVSSLASAMARMDRTWDAVKACREAGWETPAGHPDVFPAHEALIMSEHLHEINRLLVADEPDELGALMARAERQAWAMRTALDEGNKGAAAEAQRALASTCEACHTKFRN
jgi:protein tyrosine phosphatase (PTP) superfamily phosphohydrolase (DUF442 family)